MTITVGSGGTSSDRDIGDKVHECIEVATNLMVLVAHARRGARKLTAEYDPTIGDRGAWIVRIGVRSASAESLRDATTQLRQQLRGC